jgi:hypothetical protein
LHASQENSKVLAKGIAASFNVHFENAGFSLDMCSIIIIAHEFQSNQGNEHYSMLLL